MAFWIWADTISTFTVMLTVILSETANSFSGNINGMVWPRRNAVSLPLRERGG